MQINVVAVVAIASFLPFCHLAVFKYYKHARYDKDIIFQQSPGPTGTGTVTKKYYSDKRHLYGYKTELSVLRNGLVTVRSLLYAVLQQILMSLEKIQIGVGRTLLRQTMTSCKLSMMENAAMRFQIVGKFYVTIDTLGYNKI